VIRGVHAIQFATDAEAARAFFRDVLRLPSVDAGGGWLIFALPPAELGVHPTEGDPPSGHCALYLMCEEIESTVAELRSRGVVFTSPVSDAGFGRVTTLRVPGAGDIGLYQPSHPMALNAGPAPTGLSP
jgi:predicted enzyme related to lactoylglutathione lyase